MCFDVVGLLRRIAGEHIDTHDTVLALCRLNIYRLNVNVYRGSRRDLGTDCLNGCVMDCLCVETFNRL